MLGIKSRKKGIELKIKTFFNEQWKEDELIGEGSYGKVYKAKKEEFGISTYSAIKQIEIPQSKTEIQTLKTEGMTQKDITQYYESSVQKWVEEIKFMSIFKDSENVVKIEDYEIIKKKNDIGWIINIRMELLKNLDAYILENNVTDKEILKMAIDVATALEDCEANNVVHRDIKPDNIFVNRKGIYKVGDFGIAKHIEKTVSNMSKKGTENYMAPELYKNEKGNRTVDIYSLGIMLYRYFNYNRLPFLPDYPEPITLDAREEALYKRISGERMPAPQNAPREIAEMILKACSYYPKDRYSNATEFKEILKKAYNEMEKTRVLFDFNEKQMNKLFFENTKSDTHNGTLSIMEDKHNKTLSIMSENTTDEKIEMQPDQHQELNALEEMQVQEKNKEPEEIQVSEKIHMPEPTKGVEEIVEEKKEILSGDVEETEKEIPKAENKIKSKTSVKLKQYKKILIIPFILILIAIIVFAIIKLRPHKEEIQYYSMISVIGMQSEKATEELKKIELEIEYEYVETDNVEEVGKVLEQSISENQQVEKGTIVKLKIAVSKENVTMINVVGMTIDEAKVALQDIGLNTNVTEQYSEEVEQGRVISQMTVEGEEVNVGETVDLLVSLGLEIKENQEQAIQQNNDSNNLKNNTNSNNTSTQSTPQTQTPTQSMPQAQTPTQPTIQQSTGGTSVANTWSDWVETLPSGVTSSNYNIETKTQYSVRTRSTYTTTAYYSSQEQAKAPETIYSIWRMSEMTTSRPTVSDTLHILGSIKVATSGTTYYHIYAKNGQAMAAGKLDYGYYEQYNGNVHVHSMTFSKDYGKTVSGYSTTNDYAVEATQKLCPSCDTKIWYRLDYPVGSTVYIYQERTKKTQYTYYYPWSDWSVYSDTVATSSNTQEVRTRTVYRYQKK